MMKKETKESKRKKISPSRLIKILIRSTPFIATLLLVPGVLMMAFVLLLARIIERDWLLCRIAIAESKVDEQGGEEWRNEVARVEKAIRRVDMVMLLWHLCAFVAFQAMD